MDSSNFSEQDDFEFKPLTEGLGFHQKKTPVAPSKPLVQFKTDMPEIELHPKTSKQAKSLPSESLTLKTNLPKAENAKPKNSGKEPLTQNLKNATATTNVNPKATTEVATDTVDEILKTLSAKKSTEMAPSKESLRAKTALTFKPAAWEVSASLLDAMLVTATTLLCLILLLVITRIDLFANIYKPDSHGMVYWSLIALVACVSWIYLVCNRIFLGYTPGEWVFDQRLGKPEDMGSSSYALKSILRSTLVILTGFIILPAASFALNDDVLGKITGLRLFKKA